MSDSDSESDEDKSDDDDDDDDKDDDDRDDKSTSFTSLAAFGSSSLICPARFRRSWLLPAASRRRDFSFFCFDDDDDDLLGERFFDDDFLRSCSPTTELTVPRFLRPVSDCSENRRSLRGLKFRRFGGGATFAAIAGFDRRKARGECDERSDLINEEDDEVAAEAATTRILANRVELVLAFCDEPPLAFFERQLNR
jgi:hypothetical protein